MDKQKQQQHFIWFQKAVSEAQSSAFELWGKMNINKQAGQETPQYKGFYYYFNICHQMLALQ